MQVKKVLRLFQFLLTTKKNEVDSRYVNLKFISNDEFIFFSNYDSPKASSF
jgi:pyridoxine/pyridoxamine 5'-phosphate oxidase